jgi:hypothetical protein
VAVTLVRQRAVIDKRGVARFTFRAPTREGYYLGQPTFAGNSLLLSAPDFSMALRLVSDPLRPARPPILGFIDPGAWLPCFSARGR